MHHIEITEHLICLPKKKVAVEPIASEESMFSTVLEKKTDLWKIVTRKHRIGIYIISKKFLKKKTDILPELVHKIHYRIAAI